MKNGLTLEQKFERVKDLRPIDDVFVNTTIDDGTDIADLMSCFIKKEVNNPKFPELTKGVTELKTTEGGVNAMCEVMEKLMAESREKGKSEGIILTLVSLVRKRELSIKNAAEEARMSEDEFRKLLNS